MEEFVHTEKKKLRESDLLTFRNTSKARALGQPATPSNKNSSAALIFYILLERNQLPGRVTSVVRVRSSLFYPFVTLTFDLYNSRFGLYVGST
jgi:hypothetical protein